MILGYIFLAIVAGSLSSLAALLFGASFLFAFGVYTLVGTLTLVILPLTAMLIAAYSPQGNGRSASHRRSRNQNVDLGAASIDRV